MAPELPQIIDVRRSLVNSRGITGTISPQRLSRIVAPYRAVQPLDVRITVEDVSARGIRLGGQLATEIEAVCQRCLGDMTIKVVRGIDVLLVDAAESTDPTGDDDIDVITVDDGKFEITAFAEDELILACPMIPVHAPDECPVQVAESVRARPDTTRPFADLGALLEGGARGEQADD